MIVNGIFITLQVLIGVWFLYWFTISLFGFGKVKKLPDVKGKKKFLVLIPANNEAAVIGDLVDNLKLQEYPLDMVDVYVIADNCNDDTAKISRMKGAKVIEHTYLPGEPKGKPHAIRYALDNIDTSSYDAICIFDADNLVTTNFFAEMNKHLHAGHRLIQCYLDSKNPRDNFISLGYATSYYVMNRGWQVGKSRLKLGNAIGGTGFCVEMGLFNEIGWTANSLTEDLEFTMQALLKGERAHWCHHARVLDEKPTGFKASWLQRLRWSRGHWDVCFKYAGKLIRKGIKDRDILAIDGAIYLLNPGKMVLTTLISVMFYASIMGGFDLYDPFIPMWAYLFMLAYNFAYIFVALFDSNEEDMNPVYAYASMIFMNATFILLFVWSLVTFRKRVWVTTKHTRSLSQEQFQQHSAQQQASA